MPRVLRTSVGVLPHHRGLRFARTAGPTPHVPLPRRLSGFRISPGDGLAVAPPANAALFDYGPESSDWRADLGSAAVLLSRGRGFSAARPDFRQTELARLGLQNRRQIVSDEIRLMLRAKMENPMLGILGAHLLLLDPQPDEDLFQVVIQNSRSLLIAPHELRRTSHLRYRQRRTPRYHSTRDFSSC